MMHIEALLESLLRWTEWKDKKEQELRELVTKDNHLYRSIRRQLKMDIHHASVMMELKKSWIKDHSSPSPASEAGD